MYIHQINDWPDFMWDAEALSAPLAEVRHQQGLLLGKMSALGFDLRNEANLETLTVDIVKTSAIEGEALDAEQVRSSLARRLGVDIGGFTPVSRDVEGIVDIMLDATQKYADPLTQERLFGWHAALFPMGRSGIHAITVGAWRTAESGPMQVISGPMGRETVHFEAPEAELLDTEMKCFLEWFNADSEIDPVLKAAIAHFWFVTIHPFADGNGRIARAIADMALARADGQAQRFYSMTARIERERKTYYDALERCQKSVDMDITAWLEWFVACLSRALDGADNALAAVLRKAKLWERANQFQINDRHRHVINRLLDGFEGKLTSSKYAKLAKCSQDTALRDIKELLAWGVLAQNPAGGRSTSYELTEE